MANAFDAYYVLTTSIEAYCNKMQINSIINVNHNIFEIGLVLFQSLLI